MKLIAVAAAVAALALPASALADPPGLAPNPNNSGVPGTQKNCIAAFSSQSTHNGSVVSQQDRQAEIKFLQAVCAHS